MKLLYSILLIFFTLPVYAITGINGEQNPRVIVRNGKFYLYYQIESGTDKTNFILEVYSKNGKKEKVPAEIYEKFKKRSTEKKWHSLYDYFVCNGLNKTYWACPWVNHSDNILKLNAVKKIDINECFFRDDWRPMLKGQKETVDFSLEKFPFKKDEVLSMQSMIINNNTLFLLGAIGENANSGLYFFSFDLKTKKADSVLLGRMWWDLLHPHGTGVSKILKYKKSYAVIWVKHILKTDNKTYYTTKMPLYMSFIDSETEDVKTYKVMDTTTPLDMAASIIDDELFIAYAQVDPETENFVLNRKFINLKELLKQKLVLIKDTDKTDNENVQLTAEPLCD